MNNLKSNGLELTVLQQHYTSCRYGLSGHAGFQTRAISNNIQPEEQRVIERLGTYHPPRDYPVEPNQKQIDEHFPVAYRSIYIDTGKLAVVRSVYVGKDYTKRWGNYFSHTLVIGQSPKNIWPVDLYAWNGWKSRLEEDDDTEQATLNLPSITIIPDDKTYSFTALQKFLVKENSRTNHLANMIQAVLLRSKTSRSLIIKEKLVMDGLFWIACIQKSFPPTHQEKLSCSSYQFDPRSCLAVNIVIGETDFLLGENERKFQFYVFDFEDEIYSSIDNTVSEYACLISSWMCKQPEKLKSFYSFSAQFEHNTLDAGLLQMLRLFRIHTGENLILSDEEKIGILGFVALHTKQECYEAIFSIVENLVGQVDKSNDPEFINQLALFFINGHEVTNSHEIKKTAYEQILRLVDNVLFEKKFSETDLEFIRSKARAINASFDFEFAELFLSQQHLSEMQAKAYLLGYEDLSIIVNETISAIRLIGNKEKLHKDQRLLELIKSGLIAKTQNLTNVDWIFSHFTNNTEDIAEICIYICTIFKEFEKNNKIKMEQNGHVIKQCSSYLARLFHDKGDEYRYQVINLAKLNEITWKLLEEEWRDNITNQKDKIASHMDYYKHVLKHESNFTKEYCSRFSEKLWNLLSPKEQNTQAIIWLESDQLAYISPLILEAVFGKASEAVSFKLDDQKSDSLTTLIDTQIHKFNKQLQPNRLVLRRAIVEVSNKATEFKEQLIIEIGKSLLETDNKTYKEFTVIFLPRVLTKAVTPEQHHMVIKHIFIGQFVDIFMKSYQNFFAQGETNQFNDSEMAALQFWISSTSGGDANDTYLSIRMEAIQILVSRIAKLKEHIYKGLINTYRQNSNLSQAEKKELDLICHKVEVKKNTLARRFLRKGVSFIQKLINKRKDKNVEK